MTASPPATPESKRRVPAIISLWCTVVVAILIANVWLRYWRSLPDPEFEQIVDFVNETGELTAVPDKCLTYFRLPTGDSSFRQVFALTDDNRARALQVQKDQQSGHCYVFLVNVDATTLIGNFYLTGTHARLLKSAYLDDTPLPVEDAELRFQAECEFWRNRFRRSQASPSGPGNPPDGKTGTSDGNGD